MGQVKRRKKGRVTVLPRINANAEGPAVVIRDAETKVHVAAYGDDRGTPERRQHGSTRIVGIVIGGKLTSVSRAAYEAPIDKYLAAWMRDDAKGVPASSCRGISLDQHRAAMRLRRDYDLATTSVGVKLASLPVASSSRGGSLPIDQVIAEAQQRVIDALRSIRHGGVVGASVAECICCHGETAADVDARRGWIKGMAIHRLREALDDLVAHYQEVDL